jgi:hypothetical protein
MITTGLKITSSTNTSKGALTDIIVKVREFNAQQGYVILDYYENQDAVTNKTPLLATFGNDGFYLSSNVMLAVTPPVGVDITGTLVYQTLLPIMESWGLVVVEITEE